MPSSGDSAWRKPSSASRAPCALSTPEAESKKLTTTDSGSLLPPLSPRHPAAVAVVVAPAATTNCLRLISIITGREVYKNICFSTVELCSDEAVQCEYNGGEPLVDCVGSDVAENSLRTLSFVVLALSTPFRHCFSRCNVERGNRGHIVSTQRSDCVVCRCG